MLGSPKGPDIGGKSEDDANAESGAALKQYERDHPKDVNKMYK